MSNEKNPKGKIKWRCRYNWFGEVHELYTHANEYLQAKIAFSRKIASKHKVNVSVVRSQFNGVKDNLKIEEVE